MFHLGTFLGGIIVISSPRLVSAIREVAAALERARSKMLEEAERAGVHWTLGFVVPRKTG